MYKYPGWQTPLIAAFGTTELAELGQRIRTAESAIKSRIKILAGSVGDREEQQALVVGLSSLQVLKRRLPRNRGSSSITSQHEEKCAAAVEKPAASVEKSADLH